MIFLFFTYITFYTYRFFRITGESERPVDEEPMSNCCDVSFTYPGWPDSDICSECFEHAGVSEDG